MHLSSIPVGVAAGLRHVASIARAGSPPLWLLWVAFATVCVAVSVASSDEDLGLAAYYGLAIAAAVMLLGGVYRRRRPLLPWLMLASGVALLTAGDVIWDALAVAGSVPEPSIADAFYIGGSLMLILATAVLMLRGLPPLAAMLDTLVIGSAMAVLLWAVVVDPRLNEAAISFPTLVTVAAYPALDVAMLSIVIVALLSGRPLDRVAGLLAAAAVASLASDLAYAAIADSGKLSPVIDLGWLLAYMLWGAAALARPEPQHAPLAELRPRRAWAALRPYVLLGAASVPLVLTLIEQVWQGKQDAFAAAVASVVMSMLVIVRLELVVREQGRLIDDRRRLHLTLLRQATEDPLTELPNRRGLAERLESIVTREGEGLALMVLDLDDFKAVNDALGHPAGDGLLREVSDRLRLAVRTSDTVARLGGDEFAVILTPCRSAEDAGAMADRLLRSLDEPFLVDRGGIPVSGSIGVAFDHGVGATVESMLRDADIALYRAKAAGKGRWALLDAEASAAALRTLSISSELARAVTHGELELHYQPVISLETDAIESFEALLRWNHPRLGTLLPSEFLATAERSIQMSEIGRWVIDQACAAASAWRRAASSEVGVRVNVATSQLADSAFPDAVMDTLERHGLEPRLLTLEILESSLESIVGLHGRLLRLREEGVSLAIDDFGIGYSTLSHVAEIPATELKLDRSLVAGSDDTRMVRAIVNLGQTLGMRLVAEGVETDAELGRVRALGCDGAQGYRIGRPVSATEVSPLLRSWSPVSRAAPAAAPASTASLAHA